jgi:phospholipid/cholesterol/gamma-HCH transport system ATP-binding protein
VSIELLEVCKAFGNKEILTGFSLTVEDGETLSIIGYSGAGKSVTLKHIIGLMRADSGTVHVDGMDVGAMDRSALTELRRNIGYVFQFAALFDSMTIGENVAMGLYRMTDIDEEEIRARVHECLSLVDLHDVQDRYPSEMSGGMKKRVGLARAIATGPKYLLYDEPTTGLDPVTVTVIDRLNIRMKQELGVTGVVITHDMDSAYRISDRIAMLYDGKMRAVGTVEEIRDSEDPLVRAFVEGRPELMEGVS